MDSSNTNLIQNLINNQVADLIPDDALLCLIGLANDGRTYVKEERTTENLLCNCPVLVLPCCTRHNQE